MMHVKYRLSGTVQGTDELLCFYAVHTLGGRSVVVVVRHSTQRCLFLAHSHDQPHTPFIWTCAIVSEWEIVLLLYSREPNYTAHITREGSYQWEITNQDPRRRVQVMAWCDCVGNMLMSRIHSTEKLSLNWVKGLEGWDLPLAVITLYHKHW